MHADRRNVGASYQMAVGPHEGRVLVEFPTRGHLVGWPANVWSKTDGSQPHMCMPYVGKTVSLIAYTRVVSLAPESSTQRLVASKLGFPLPSESVAASALAAYRAEPQADRCLRSATVDLKDL